MTKFIPIFIMMLFTITVTSCTRNLDFQEDLSEGFNLDEQKNFKIQSKGDDSTSSSNTELYPDPDVPIKDTHDWKNKTIAIKN